MSSNAFGNPRSLAEMAFPDLPSDVYPGALRSVGPREKDPSLRAWIFRFLSKLLFVIVTLIVDPRLPQGRYAFRNALYAFALYGLLGCIFDVAAAVSVGLGVYYSPRHPTTLLKTSFPGINGILRTSFAARTSTSLTWKLRKKSRRPMTWRAIPGRPLFLAAAFGLTLAPHFDKPFLASSATDFWARRWNLVAGTYLRDLCFAPIVEGSWLGGGGGSDAGGGGGGGGSGSGGGGGSSGSGGGGSGGGGGGEGAIKPSRPSAARRFAGTSACFLASGLMHEMVMWYLTAGAYTRPLLGSQNLSAFCEIGDACRGCLGGV